MGIEEVYTAIVSYIHTDEKSIECAAFGACVIELPGADHYVFLSNEADERRELRAFLDGLRQASVARR